MTSTSFQKVNSSCDFVRSLRMLFKNSLNISSAIVIFALLDTKCICTWNFIDGNDVSEFNTDFWTDSNMTVTKENLLSYLKRTSGSKIISGTQPYSEYFPDIMGKNPGLLNDFIFGSQPEYAERLVKKAVSDWSAGSFVSFSLFLCVDMGIAEKCEKFPTNNKSFSESNWNDLLTNGSELNSKWKFQLDSLVPYLKELEAAEVVTMLDPFALPNFRSFWWWGDKPGVNGSIKMYQITRDYLTRHHKLNSLLWKWSFGYNSDKNRSQLDQLNDYWPGNEYVDIVSLDVWLSKSQIVPYEVYETFKVFANDKPMFLESLFTIPEATFFQQQPKWVAFTLYDNHQSYQNLNSTVHSPVIIYQGEIYL